MSPVCHANLQREKCFTNSFVTLYHYLDDI